MIPQELFKKVVPYHCLGSIWSQRDKKGKEHLAPTVRATVTQFNSVANCVITTCLGDRTVTARDRARVVEHWIEVARVCLGGALGNPFLAFVCPQGCGLWSTALQRPQPSLPSGSLALIHTSHCLNAHCPLHVLPRVELRASSLGVSRTGAQVLVGAPWEPVSPRMEGQSSGDCTRTPRLFCSSARSAVSSRTSRLSTPSCRPCRATLSTG